MEGISIIIVKPIVKKVADNQKERLELCLNFVSDPKNRKFTGITVMGLGAGVIVLGAGIFASGCIH